MMKKLLVAFMALAMAVTAATASIGIQWGFSGYGIYDNEGTLGADEGYLLESHDMIWQLIFSATETIEPPNPANEAGRYVATTPGADDRVLAERIISQGGGAAVENRWDEGAGAWVSDEAKGTEWNVYPEKLVGDQVYSDMNWATAGFVYQRVFQGIPNPLTDTYYYDSVFMTPTFSTTWPGGSTPPENFSLSDSFRTDQVITAIPEPATMSLLGLGALVMAIRRRRS